MTGYDASFEDTTGRARRMLLAAERVGQFGGFEWELASNAVRWSPGMYALYGVDPTTAPPITFEYAMLFVHPDDATEIKRQVRRALDEPGRSVTVQYRITRPDGAERVMRGLGEVERDATGAPVRLIGAVHDWSDWAAAQVALQRSEQRYRELVNHAAFGIYRSSMDGRFLDVNAAMVEMLGYESEEDLLGADIARDIYVDAEQRAQVIASQGLREREAVEVNWKRKDGTPITVRLRGTQSVDHDGEQTFTVIAEDVTRRRDLERQLLQSQKMDSIGRLAGGVAHDFNNILTAISSYADLLLGELPPVSPHRRDVEEIRLSANRAASLTRQLLAFSRQQIMSPRILELNQIVAAMEKMLRRIIGEDVALETTLDATGKVRADPSQVEQVLLNLVVNARDAMRGGGRLILETRDVTIAQRPGDPADAAPPGAYVVLRVTDTGIGMDAATLARVFEPFFTTKPVGQGTGLGLATVYGIVQQSGGQITVRSVPGEGTTFDVYLPRVEGAIEWPGRSELHDERSPRGRETVLLVEDDPGVRRVARLALERGGYRVIEADGPPAALELCGRDDAHFDLLLTDVVMPMMSGRDLCDALRARRPELPVLYMSGYPGSPGQRDGTWDADEPFLAKPFTAEALADAVRSALDAPRRNGAR